MTIVFSGSPVANVQLSDSFNTWRLTTNKLLADAASLTANNTFAGTLSATGAATFSNTVSVAGPVTLSRTMVATGNVTANSFIGDGGSLTGVATTMATDGGANRSLKIPFTGISSGTLTTANVDSTLLYNPSTGTLTATKVTAVNLNFSSDSKLKDNVQTLADSSNIVSRLRGVSFNWKDSGEAAFGVIAQELQQVVPQLVDTNENGDLTVQYLGLIAFLIESNKQLLDRVDALESK
jgi:hypothetical protein